MKIILDKDGCLYYSFDVFKEQLIREFANEVVHLIYGGIEGPA